MDRLQHLDHSRGWATIEIIDVQDDPLDVRWTVTGLEERDELLEVLVDTRHHAEVLAMVVGRSALEDEVLETALVPIAAATSARTSRPRSMAGRCALHGEEGPDMTVAGAAQ